MFNALAVRTFDHLQTDGQGASPGGHEVAIEDKQLLARYRGNSALGTGDVGIREIKQPQ